MNSQRIEISTLTVRRIGSGDNPSATIQDMIARNQGKSEETDPAMTCQPNSVITDTF